MPKITLTFSFGCSFAEASILAKSKLSRPLKCLANFSMRLLVVSHVVHHGVNTCFKTVMGFNMGMQYQKFKTMKPLDQLKSSLSSFFCLLENKGQGLGGGDVQHIPKMFSILSYIQIRIITKNSILRSLKWHLLFSNRWHVSLDVIM